MYVCAIILCVYNGYIWEINLNWILDVQYIIARDLVLGFSVFMSI